MAHRPTFAADFDGFICEHRFPECGPPITETVELLRLLHEHGWRIVIHSCRTNSNWVVKGASEQEARAKVDDMLSWLIEHRVPFDAVWGISGFIIRPDRIHGAWHYSKVSGKPVADVYGDDRALHPGALTASQMHQICQRVVERNGDPLAYHRSLGRSAD